MTLKELIQREFSHEFIRFVLIAGLNTAFGYGVYALFIWLGVHFSLATLLSTILGILFNFKTYGVIVFRNKNNQLILRFILVYGFLYLCNVASIAILKQMGLTSYLAGFIMLIPIGLLGYFFNKRFVYNRTSITKENYNYIKTKKNAEKFNATTNADNI